MSLEAGFAVSKYLGHPQYLSLFLCLLHLDQDATSHLFLPLCLCSTITDSKPLKPETQIKHFIL